MEFETIEQQVEYINNELLTGRTMKDIENNDFNVNDRVIGKRLVRQGYRKIEGLYRKPDNIIQSFNSCISPIEKPVKMVTNKSVKTIEDKEPVEVLNNLPSNLDINSLVELTSLIEPIKILIQEYNKSINIVEVEQIELKVKKTTNVRQKLFKIDFDTLDHWEEFCKTNSEYRVQDLISLALEEFINKYNK